MAVKASSRLIEIADALPLHPGMRVLEIGCGPGVLARLIAERLKGDVFVLGIDRSLAAIAAAMAQIAESAYPATLAFRQSAAEHFTLAEGEEPPSISPSPSGSALSMGVIQRPAGWRFHASAEHLSPEVACSSMAAIRCARFR